jgi:hypothetical protein
MLSIEILRQFIPLCWLKHNPLELTRSTAFLKQNLLFFYIVEYFMQTNMTDDPFESFLEVSIEIALTLLFIGFILYLNRTLYAFVQTTTAVLFCTNVVSVFIIPNLVWLTLNEYLVSYYVLGLLFIWELALIAYVFRKTLAINLSASIALSAVYFIIVYMGSFSIGQMLI